jgi:hypothetical protein
MYFCLEVQLKAGVRAFGALFADAFYARFNCCDEFRLDWLRRPAC